MRFLIIRASARAAIARAAKSMIIVGLLATAGSIAFADGDPSAGGPQASSGAIIGVVTNPDQLPVPRAKVTAVRADGGSFRATLSAVDGSYSFSDLAPGKWSITSHVDGYPNV